MRSAARVPRGPQLERRRVAVGYPIGAGEAAEVAGWPPECVPAAPTGARIALVGRLIAPVSGVA